mgnify:CR=1 FL=1
MKELEMKFLANGDMIKNIRQAEKLKEVVANEESCAIVVDIIEVDVLAHDSTNHTFQFKDMEEVLSWATRRGIEK